ncbi:MAG: histidine phosphatase family protein [Pseudomonadota bacterium]
MTDLYIVRHGNTFDTGDIITRVGARTDLALSISGCAQAEALAAHFSHIVPKGFSRAYCSPLLRTRQTAEIILEKSAAAPALETLEFLREVDYGPDENKPEAAVIARLGEAALRAWETDAVPPPGWQINPDALRTAWRDLFHFVSASSERLPVLIVTSNGIARFLLSEITAFKTRPDSIKLKTGAYGIVRALPGSTMLTAWNVRP